jgi:hypothetical protein
MRTESRGVKGHCRGRFHPWWLTAAVCVLSAGLHAAPQPAPQPAYPLCVQSDCGLVDGRGNWLTQPIYSRLRPSGPYWVAERRSGLVGLLDAQGKVMIAPRFREIGEFADGLAPAQGTQSKHYGYIGAAGDWVIQPRFQNATAFYRGVARVTLGDDAAGPSRVEFIDLAGQPVAGMPRLANGHSPARVKGLSVVETPQPGGATQVGVLNDQGKFVVAPKSGQSIALHSEGGIVVRQADSEQLKTASGNTVFRLDAGEPSIELLGEGRAAFWRPHLSRSEEPSLGLVDSVTGQVVAAPRRGWDSIEPFSEGLAAFVAKDLWGYVDRAGKVVIEPAFTQASPFYGGLAIASKGHSLDGLIDRRGRWQREPEAGVSMQRLDKDDVGGLEHLRQLVLVRHPQEAGQEPGPGLRPEEAEQIPAAQMPLVSELLLGLKAMATVRKHPCGMDVAFNASGQRIWPENLLGACAEAQGRRTGRNPDPLLPDRARAAQLQEKRRAALDEAEYIHEINLRDRHRGDIREMTVRHMYPEKAQRDRRMIELVREAGWMTGPQELVLQGPVSIRLPAGVRLLLPEKVARLQAQLRQEMETPLPIPRAYLELQERWRAKTISEAEYRRMEKFWQQVFPEVPARVQAEQQARNPSSDPAHEQAKHGARRGEYPPPEQRIGQSAAARGLSLPPLAMLADVDERWQMWVRVHPSGHLPVSEDRLPPPEAVIQAINLYGFWSGEAGALRRVTGRSHDEWLSPLRIEEPGKILTWSWEHSQRIGYEAVFRGGFRNFAVRAMVPGRSHVVQIGADWEGLSSESLALAYGPQVLEMARQIRFAPGQAHGDYVAGDQSVLDPLEYVIAGQGLEPVQARPAKPKVDWQARASDEGKRPLHIRNLLEGLLPPAFLLLVGAVLAFLRFRARRKRP